ncbi:UNVERIFIED_CONTAM: hypothetical protein GTU68_016287 [Idotea baltica]|nr:hypothetical protein [Idotea baltica]
MTRVNYYHKANQVTGIPQSAQRFCDLSIRQKTSYYLDLNRVMRYFPRNARISHRFGDVRDVSAFPRIVKTRPLGKNNNNSILLKLNSVRHFRKINDPFKWEEKKDLLVWRGKVKKDHRQEFFLKHFHNPHCDLGKTNDPGSTDPQGWNKPFMSIAKQLKYKFVLSIEGNEVATNLKWIAQSNSLCLMTKPKFESWFMEGTLIAGYHYVELNEDYADLSEKISYYLKHPDEAKAIVTNLNDYYRQFENTKKERIISLLVMAKYLMTSGQLAPAQPESREASLDGLLNLDLMGGIPGSGRKAEGRRIHPAPTIPST